jgi:hypothetical protein
MRRALESSGNMPILEWFNQDLATLIPLHASLHASLHVLLHSSIHAHNFVQCIDASGIAWRRAADGSGQRLCPSLRRSRHHRPDAAPRRRLVRARHGRPHGRHQPLRLASLRNWRARPRR